MLKIRRKNNDFNHLNHNLTLKFEIEGQSDKKNEEYLQRCEKWCKEQTTWDSIAIKLN